MAIRFTAIHSSMSFFRMALTLIGRTRVLEYLSGLSGRLPCRRRAVPWPGRNRRRLGVHVSINSTNRDLAQLRSMQDWYLRYQLASVEGVSEVASIGGFVKQYQVTVDPTKLRAYNLSISEVAMAVKKSNGEVGGRSIELSEGIHPPSPRLHNGP